MDEEKKLKVVVVDDEQTVLSVIRRQLENKKCKVAEASGALEAFSLLAEVDPDFWIIDVRLPGINGLELAQMIRSADPKAGILLMTGYPDSETMERVSHISAASLLEKPFDPRVLNDIVTYNETQNSSH
jgi:DNA-binding NtrC family response regulator